MSLGPTGKFPRGKLRFDDEGGLKMALVVRGDTIVMEFGKKVRWIGFGVEEARELAVMLNSAVDKIRGQRN